MLGWGALRKGNWQNGIKQKEKQTGKGRFCNTSQSGKDGVEERGTTEKGMKKKKK